jgi:hypothetical protein
VETEDASLNKEVIVYGSLDHDCYIGGLIRQYEVVIEIEALVLAEVAVTKSQSVSEVELFRDKVKNLDGIRRTLPTRPGKWWDPTA